MCVSVFALAVLDDTPNFHGRTLPKFEDFCPGQQDFFHSFKRPRDSDQFVSP